MTKGCLSKTIQVLLDTTILLVLILGIPSTSFAQAPNDQKTLINAMDSVFQVAIENRRNLDWKNYYDNFYFISDLPYDSARAQYFIDFIQSESIHLKEELPIQAAYVWNYAARLHVVNGYFEKALSFYERTAEGLRPYEDTIYLPQVYLYLSQLAIRAESNSVKSFAYINEAERIYNTKVQKDSSFIGEIFYVKGWAMRAIDEEKSIQIFRNAQRLLGDNDGDIESFIARSLLGLRRFEEALVSAEIMTLKYEQFYEALSSEGYSLAGQALSGLGRFEEAIEKIQKSIEIVRSQNRSTDYELIKLFYFLAQAQEKAGKYEESLSSCQVVFQKAIPGYHPTSNYDTPNLEIFWSDNLWVLEALELKSLALKNSYQKTGRIEALQAAVYTYKQSIQDIENRRKLRFNWASKKQFNDYIFYAYEEALVCAAMLYEADASIENRNLLFSFLERSKATLLRENIQEVERYKKLDSEAKKKRAELQQQIADAETELLEEESNEDSQELANIQKKVFELHTEWEQFLQEHAMTFEHLKTPERSLEDLQSNLEDSTALLAYHVGEEYILAFRIEQEEFSVDLLKRNGSLVQNYQGMHEGLSNWEAVLAAPQKSLALFQQHADTLSQLLLNPVLDLSPAINNLIILADDLLHGIPFEVLTLPGQDHFLLEDFNISYAYTVSSLKMGEGSTKKDIRSFGGYAPSYTWSENKLAKDTIDIATAQSLALRSGLIDIPEARANLKDLADRFGGFAWTEKAATKEHFIANAGTYDLLHLGMHGQLDTNSSFLSHLVFYGEKENELFLRELQAMNIPSELVVLSACNTGVGTHINGEGPLSLARAFFYAGAKSTLMSLWQVPDQQTAKIMRLFYDNIDKGLSKNKALTEAKRSFLKTASSLESHPAFWSGFVLVGDPSPLAIRSGLSYGWMLAFGLLGLLALGYGFYKKR